MSTERPLHVVLDGRSIHSHMGGIGRAAWDLAAALAAQKNGHRLTILVGPRLPSNFALQGAELLQVDAAMIDERFEQLQLPVLLERLHADFYFNTTFSIPAVKTTRFQGAIIHDIVFEEKPEWVEPPLREYLSKWSRFTAEHADRVVTVSDDARTRIASAYGVRPGKILRIYNGMRVDAFARPSDAEIAATLARYDLASPYLLYLGSLEPKKGILELVTAFATVARRDPAVSLVLAGARNRFSPEIDGQIAGSEARTRIVQLGYVDERDKKALLAGSRLFVYPSLYEGFGLPPLEAMALGVPCVTSGETSLPEVVGDAALVADVRDARAFADALERGSSPEFRAKAAQVGPARTRLFSWDKAAREFLNLCDSLEAA